VTEAGGNQSGGGVTGSYCGPGPTHQEYGRGSSRPDDVRGQTSTPATHFGHHDQELGNGGVRPRGASLRGRDRVRQLSVSDAAGGTNVKAAPSPMG
jgi:hypothetical protein